MYNEKFPELARFDKELEQVRIAIEGSPAVKQKGKEYLPSPATIDYTDPERKAQQDKHYKKYLLNAEFDEYTAQTMAVMLGKLNLSDARIEVPDKIAYLLEKADGESLSFKNGLLGSACENVLQAKWHISIVDYQGLPSVPVENPSTDQANKINSLGHVVIKSYPRESLVQYDTGLVDGKEVLTFIKLVEHDYTFNRETGLREPVKAYITLALDEDGEYYQEKHVENIDGAVIGEVVSNYIKVKGKALRMIPAWVFCDKELKSGEFPQELGYLSRIADICMQRYRLSADFKDYLSNLEPTNYIGIGQVDPKEFKKDMETINGTALIKKGDNNVLPVDNFNIQSSAAGGDLSSYFRVFEGTKQTLKDYGAFIPDTSSKETATKAKIDAGQQNAVLIPLVSNLIEGVKSLIFYAGIFESLWGQDDKQAAVDQIEISISKDLEKISLTTKEQAELVSAQLLLLDSGRLGSEEMSLQVLHQNNVYPDGWTLDDIKASINNGVEQ